MELRRTVKCPWCSTIWIIGPKGEARIGGTMFGNILGKLVKVGLFAFGGQFVALAGTLIGKLVHNVPVDGPHTWGQLVMALLGAGVAGMIAAAERWKNFDPTKLTAK